MRIIHNMLMNRKYTLGAATTCTPKPCSPLSRSYCPEAHQSLYLLTVLLPTMLVLFVVGCGGGKY